MEPNARIFVVIMLTFKLGHCRFVAVLEIQLVDSAQKAVQVQIVKDVRDNK